MNLPRPAAKRRLLLDGDEMDRHGPRMDLGQDAEVEGHLMGVAVAPDIGLEVGDVVAGFQINQPALRVEPVKPCLTRHAVVVGTDHALRHAGAQEFAGDRVGADGVFEVGQQSGLFGRKDRIGRGGTDREVGVEALAAFQDEDMGRPAQCEGGAVVDGRAGAAPPKSALAAPPVPVAGALSLTRRGGDGSAPGIAKMASESGHGERRRPAMARAAPVCRSPAAAAWTHASGSCEATASA